MPSISVRKCTKTLNSYHLSLLASQKNMTIQVLKRSVEVNNTPLYDMESVIARLRIVRHKMNIELSLIFQNELCCVPPSLIKFLRKANLI